MISERKKYEKSLVFEKFRGHEKDCGSTRVQIAFLTKQINDLQVHLGENKKDIHSTTGMKKLVGKRNRLLNYLKTNSLEEYKSLIAALNLRK